MATYKYRQNCSTGASDGYILYNVTPDFETAALTVGDTFTINGQTYLRNYKTQAIAVDISPVIKSDGSIDVRHRVRTQITKSVAKATKATFSMTVTITQDLINHAVSLGLGRQFTAYLNFQIIDTDNDEWWCLGSSAQGTLCLQSRLSPVIASVSFTDSTGGLARFGNMVQNESDVAIVMSVTLDPLDPGISVASRRLVLDGTIYDLTGNSFDFGKLNMAGVKTWSLTVIDNRGLSVSTSGTLTFLAYSIPTLTAINGVDVVQRYETKMDDEGATIYVAADDGINVWFSFIANIASVSESNAWTLTCTYREYDSSSVTIVNFLSGSDGQSITRHQERSFLENVSFNQTKRYSFVLTLQDFYHTITLVFDIDKAGGYAFIGKYSVAVGMRGTGTIDDKKFEVAEDYTAHFHGGIAATEEYTPEMLTGVDTPGSLGGSLVFRRVGNMVFISGTIKFTVAATTREICDVPDSFMPSDRITWIAAVTGSRIARLYINRRAADDTGVLVLEWVKTVNSTSSVSETFVWVDCGYTYWAG